MHLTMPFVTRNADEGAGVSRWRHPFNLVGPPQNLGILAWTSRTLLSILRPEWGDADIAARIEQSTRPMSDAQWARMLDFGVVSTIMFTYLLRRREKIPRFQTPRGARASSSFKSSPRYHAESSSSSTSRAHVAPRAMLWTFHPDEMPAEALNRASERSGVEPSFFELLSYFTVTIYAIYMRRRCGTFIYFKY